MAPKILVVLTSHDQLGTTGKPTGWVCFRFLAPVYELPMRNSLGTQTLANKYDEIVPCKPASTETTSPSRQDPGTELTLAPSSLSSHTPTMSS